MYKSIKIFTTLSIFFLFLGLFSSFNTVEAGTLRCKLGACNTDADCLGAQNGGVAVCKEDGKGYKECVNAFCPYGKTIAGANCDCSAGRTCGQTCNASIGLCQDGKSTCRYIVGPSCTNSQPFVNDTTYCIPDTGAGITLYKCVARDQWNSYALYNGANPTLAQIAQSCASILCQPSNPNPAALLLPVDNAQVVAGVNNSVPISYNVNNGWGVGCPANNNTYNVQLSPNCTGTYVNWGAVTQFTGLTKGQTYCWRVGKNNGSSGVIYSAVNRFTVIDDSINLSSSGVAADVCGSGFSGVAGIAGVSNPIDYVVNFSSATGNTIKEIWLAMVPDNNAYNNNTFIDPTVKGNMDALDVDTQTNILLKVANSRSLAFKIILSGGVPSEIQAYNGSTWNSQTVTGSDISGLGGSLLGLNTTTTASASATSATANFRIRMDTVQLGKYSFYTAALFTDALGNLKTSYSNPTSFFQYKKGAVFGAFTNWGVDLQLPSATSAFSNVKYVAAGSSVGLQVNWNIQEYNSLQFKSFVTRNNTDSFLTDNGTGTALDFGGFLPNTINFDNGSLSLSAIPASGSTTTSAASAGVDQSNAGIKTYTDSDPSKQTSYTFYAFSRDIACNQKAVTTTATLQNPWVLGYNGNVSASKGIVSLNLPSSLNQLSGTLNDKQNNPILSDLQSVFLSSYGTISGTNDMPLSKQSKLQQYVTKYQDLSILPPADSGFPKWYDFLYDVVTKNSASNLVKFQPATSQTISTTTSALLGVATGEKANALIDGKLTVNADTICDTKTIFFVTGSTSITLDPVYVNASIKISPDFTASDSTNGCIFVSSSDILIDNGNNINGGLTIDNAQLAKYDLVEAAIVTDGKFITKKDVSNSAEKGDGLVIKGSVVANNVSLKRDVNLNSNQLQPAQVFYFDPRYREIFKNDLNYNKYSIREIGYTSN